MEKSNITCLIPIFFIYAILFFYILFLVPSLHAFCSPHLPFFPPLICSSEKSRLPMEVNEFCHHDLEARLSLLSPLPLPMSSLSKVSHHRKWLQKASLFIRDSSRSHCQWPH